MTALPERLAAALADRYRLERELGAGGMATVYLAQDLKHDRQVALKVLRPELAATLGSERFLSEIATTARLNHPHILPLYDSGDAGGFLYYVMPLVTGESLRDRLTREKVLPVEEAVRLAREVAEGLWYAHAHDVIHRDIKPENILLQSGHAIVADFGIARALRAAGDERMTQTGMAIGTPAYMSPEQSAGERDLDGRSDLYALASVLYEMLAGEPPFTGATMDAILVQRFTRQPPRVSTKRASVPRAIDAALYTAMARAPEDRFPTVERFAAALTAPGPAADAEPDRSVAVLPFANMSGDAENEYFSDGISEEIINALAQLPGLRVAARTSAFSFKGKNVNLREIGDQLSVGTVLEGSVRKAGGRIRITAQLISVADGYHLWSERYDRELTDVFAIQDEIATAIAEKLKVTLRVSGESRLVRPPTDNVEAYELLLKGRALMRQRGPSLARAAEAFAQAIALDGGLALAHAELAQSLILQALYGLVSPAEIGEQTRRATARALELEPELATARLVEGMFADMVEFDRAGAATAYARAVELDPQDADARSIQAAFDFCYLRGDFPVAQAQLQEILDTDPLNTNALGQLSIALSFAGDTARAAETARRAIAVDGQSFYAHWALLNALMLGPDPEAAVAAGRPMLGRFARHPWLLMGMAFAQGAAGRPALAESLHAELAARAAGEYVQPMALAVAAIGTGRPELVFRHLRDAATIRDPLLAAMALHWPGLDPWRDTAEYAALLSQIGWNPSDA